MKNLPVDPSKEGPSSIAARRLKNRAPGMVGEVGPGVPPLPDPRPHVTVREAKDRLSELLQRAADGEQIVVTSDGVPRAMIVRFKRVLTGRPWMPNRDFLNSLPMTPDSTEMIRAERDSGY